MKRLFSPNIYGALLIVGGGVLSAFTNVLVHGLSVPLPTFQMVFFKTATSLVLLTLYYRRNLKRVTKTSLLKVHALKGLFGAVGNFFWFGALLYLPLVQSSALSLTSALFTSLGAWLFFKEAFRWNVLFCLVLGFSGALFILNPFSNTWSVYALLPLASALCFSGSSLIVKVLSQKDPSETTLFYLMFFMCLFSLGPALFYWQTPSMEDLGRLILVGGLYTATQLFLIEAYTHAQASFIAPFKFARFPLNGLAGLFLFFEIPHVFTLIGGGLIVASNLWLLKFERKKKL